MKTSRLEGLNADFRDLLLLFADGGVEFIVVGAYALGFHGAPRASGDIDLYVNPQDDNAEKVAAALTEFGAPLVAHGVSHQDFATAGTVYQIGLPPGSQKQALQEPESKWERVVGRVEIRPQASCTCGLFARCGSL